MTNNDATKACANKDMCSCCGAPTELADFDQQAILTIMMRKRQLCFTCAFWLDKIEHPHPDREIVNGLHCIFHQWQKLPHFSAFRGTTAYILKKDGTVKRSNNVWFQGCIPERFKPQLPDTAKFITKEAYYKIRDNVNFFCNKKGCWDRYNCFFYHKELMEANGAWNKIPESHKTGDENCELFLNKDKVFTEQ